MQEYESCNTIIMNFCKANQKKIEEIINNTKKDIIIPLKSPLINVQKDERESCFLYLYVNKEKLYSITIDEKAISHILVEPEEIMSNLYCSKKFEQYKSIVLALVENMRHSPNIEEYIANL